MTQAVDHAEMVFETLSLALDRVPRDGTELFLAKLCLLLALAVPTASMLTEAIDTAERDLR